MRRWIKVRLQNTAEAYEAADIVEWWKADRAATIHIVKAVRLYFALLRGDLSLLVEYFPFINAAINSGYHASVVRQRPAGGKIEYVEKNSEEDSIDLLDSLGL